MSALVAFPPDSITSVILGAYVIIEYLFTYLGGKGEPSNRQIWLTAARLFPVATVAIWLGSTPIGYSVAIAAYSSLWYAGMMFSFREVSRARARRAQNLEETKDQK
jgi:hypothetical protein